MLVTTIPNDKFFKFVIEFNYKKLYFFGGKNDRRNC